MKKSKILLAALAVVLILTVSIAPALAYFYAADTDTGVAPLAPLPPSTEITEDPEPGMKTITINNTGAIDVYVRVKAIAPVDVSKSGDTSAKWTGPDGEGWYNYSEPVPAGGSTDPMKLTFPMDSLTPEQLADLGVVEDGDMINVVVVYEAVPVIYDNGVAQPADWSMTLELVDNPNASSGTEGGNG